MDLDRISEIQHKLILHWNYREYKYLPEELKAEGSHIEEVYLKGNKLLHLPPWVGAMRSLTNLYLHGNNLCTLPKEFGELRSLTYLDVGQNVLFALPQSIGKLHNLLVLAAPNNYLTSLPSEMTSLTSLKVLDLSENFLRHVPDFVCDYSYLEEINLDGNLLTSLPPRIVYLPYLHNLSLANNRLLYLPALPFTSHPSIKLDYNPGLNYVSHSLGSQLPLHQAARLWTQVHPGCFQKHMDHLTYLRNIILRVSLSTTDDVFINLVMPDRLAEISKPMNCQTQKIPSLYELCLRKTYRSLYSHAVFVKKHHERQCFSMHRKLKDHSSRYIHVLPSFMQTDLQRGPVGLCFKNQCQEPIFRFAVIWVVSTLENENRTGEITPPVAIIMFCSQKCSSYFKKSHDNTYKGCCGKTLASAMLHWNII